jgi:hypothetical protein
MAKDSNHYFAKEDTQADSKHMTKGSTSLTSREMQLTAATRDTATGLATPKNSARTRHWWGRGANVAEMPLVRQEKGVLALEKTCQFHPGQVRGFADEKACSTPSLDWHKSPSQNPPLDSHNRILPNNQREWLLLTGEPKVPLKPRVPVTWQSATGKTRWKSSTLQFSLGEGTGKGRKGHFWEMEITLIKWSLHCQN